MAETRGTLFELVDDEDLEKREVVLSREGVLSLAASTGVVLSSILLSKVTACEVTNRVPSPPPSTPYFGFIINTVGYHWSLFALSEEDRSRWLLEIQKNIPAKQSPKSSHSGSVQERRKSETQKLFFPESRVSAVESGSVFDLEEEESRPVTRFSGIDEEDAPIDTERIDSVTSLMIQKTPLKQSQGIAAPSPRPAANSSTAPSIASSLPINITSRMRQWQPTIKNTEYPADDDNEEDFVQPHEKAAQTYKEYYIKTGLQLETPSASERRVRAYY